MKSKQAVVGIELDDHEAQKLLEAERVLNRMKTYYETHVQVEEDKKVKDIIDNAVDSFTTLTCRFSIHTQLGVNQ